MSRAFQDHQIRQYLLGDLSAPEEGELEMAYFRDRELLARVELARDDLADDYAAMRLSPADRERFERRMLATAEGREQLAITRALRKAAAGAPEVLKRPAWRLDRRWLSLAAIVPLAIGVFFAWRVVSGPGRLGELSEAGGQRTAQPERSTPSSPPSEGMREPEPPAGDRPRSGSSPGVTLATVILTADLERSGGLPPTLLTSTGATHVDLVAPRTGLTPGAARARVESVEGASVWSGSTTIPEADAPDPRPRARVPVSALPPGDYFFSIESTRPTDASGAPRYYFRVRAR